MLSGIYSITTSNILITTFFIKTWAWETLNRIFHLNETKNVELGSNRSQPSLKLVADFELQYLFRQEGEQ